MAEKILECDGKVCVGVEACPYHRMETMKAENKVRLAAIDRMLAAQDETIASIEEVDLKAASRKASKRKLLALKQSSKMSHCLPL